MDQAGVFDGDGAQPGDGFQQAGVVGAEGPRAAVGDDADEPVADQHGHADPGLRHLARRVIGRQQAALFLGRNIIADAQQTPRAQYLGVQPRLDGQGLAVGHDLFALVEPEHRLHGIAVGVAPDPEVLGFQHPRTLFVDHPVELIEIEHRVDGAGDFGQNLEAGGGMGRWLPGGRALVGFMGGCFGQGRSFRYGRFKLRHDMHSP